VSEKLPASWAWSELQDITEISPKFDADDLHYTELVHFVPMAAVAENFGGADVSQLRPLNEVRKGYTFFAEGDVLFAKITPCMENGKGALVPHLDRIHAFGSTEFHVLRPSKAISGKWLAHFMSQPSFRKTARHNMTGTAGQLRVPTKWLQTVRAPIPPRAEQTRIVAKLEELLSDLDAGVAELKAAQKKLRQYRQSLLKAAVEGALTASWRETQWTANTPLETGTQLLEHILRQRRARWEEKQLAKFKEQGKTPPKDWQKKYPEPVAPDTTGLPALPERWVWASMDQLSHFVRNGISKTPNTNSIGYPILRINAVRPMSVNFDEFKNIDLVADEAADYFIENGDLLATRYNGSVDLLGVVGLVRSLPFEMLHPDKLIRMKPVVEGALGRWIEIAANTSYSRMHILKRVKTTAGQTGISGEDLKKMPIPLPPLAEQGISVDLVSGQLAALIEQHSAVERAFKQSTAQRQNILRAAFAGQLVPQDPDDEPASVLLERIRSERAAQAAPKRPRGRKTEEAAA
jgi:type I restriction enzyme S subunit